MAVEPKRGCGYRKVGGLYLAGSGIARPCDRMPIPLGICPCCGNGFKFSRGWTWVDVLKLVGGKHEVVAMIRTDGKAVPTPHLYPGQILDFEGDPALIDLNKYVVPCPEAGQCTLCGNPESIGRAGLLWIGGKFYPTPQEFMAEGYTLGFSRRIKSVPHNFRVGETWVLLAHLKAIEIQPEEKTFYKPGIFYMWLPQRIEKILLESQRESDEVKVLEKRGITPVFVPDGDLDHHQGSIWDSVVEIPEFPDND